MMRPSKHRTLFVFILHCSVVSALPVSYADELIALEAKISQIANEENIGAVAYGIVSKDELLTAVAKGSYSRDQYRKISLDSIFRIGSISKTFTALGTLLLEHQGHLDTSLPVKHYIEEPPFTNLWPDKYPITSSHLLEHTAGFRDMSRKEFDQLLPLPLASAFKVDPTSRVTAWRPGFHSSYSNSGAGVLTAVIEAITQESFEIFMHKNVFSPLALHSASFAPPKNIDTTLVKGYDNDGVTRLPYWHQLYPAFGALNISVNDMLRFVQVLLNDGAMSSEQILPREVIRKMPAPSSSLAAKAGLKYGYGKGLYHFQHKGETFHGHGGDADGYLAFMAFSKPLNRGYFVVINAYKPPALKKIRVTLQDFITRNAQPNFPEPLTLGDKDADLLLGHYREVTTRFASSGPARTLVISKDIAGKYFTQINENQKRQLQPVTNRLFRRNWQSVATIALVNLKDEIYLQGDFGNFIKAGN